jgi:NAD(P)-dependent dehydrogenase (short-subunit alcohol dehydrogenase family)
LCIPTLNIIAPTRKALPPHKKLTNPVSDRLQSLVARVPEWAADGLICSLGTTMAKAGSEAAFREVEYVLPLQFAANLIATTTDGGGFWEKPLEAVELLNVGLRSHFVASYYAAPLLIANGRGLIVNTGHYGAVCYFRGPVYGAQKAGADKMAADMATELRPHNVAAVSIWMGGLDTERARAYLASLPPESRPTTKRESPQFTGRVIAALYDSDQRMQLSGRALIGAELGAFLGVTDLDGSHPLSYRYTMGGPPELHHAR